MELEADEAGADDRAPTASKVEVAPQPLFTVLPSTIELTSATPLALTSLQGGDPGYRAVHLYLGGRNLSDAQLTPATSLYSIGVEWADEKADNAIGYEVGFFWAASQDRDGMSGATAETSQWELALGARRTFFRESVIMPYIGAGLNYMNLDAKITSGGMNVLDDAEGSAGLYAHVGVMGKLGDAFRLGVDYRVVRGFSETAFDIIGAGGQVKTDADYDQLSIVLGFAF